MSERLLAAPYLPEADLLLIAAAKTGANALAETSLAGKRLSARRQDVQAFRLITNRAHLDGDRSVAKGAARDQVRKEMPMPPLILSSDSHVFEPPDLWQTRIDAPFRDRAPRIQRINGTDQIVVEADQILSGIGLISNAGARFEAPETISAQGRFEDVHRGVRPGATS